MELDDLDRTKVPNHHTTRAVTVRSVRKKTVAKVTRAFSSTICLLQDKDHDSDGSESIHSESDSDLSDDASDDPSDDTNEPSDDDLKQDTGSATVCYAANCTLRVMCRCQCFKRLLLQPRTNVKTSPSLECCWPV